MTLRSHLSRIVLSFAVVFALGCANTSGRERVTAWERDSKARAHYDLGASYLDQGRNAMALREFLEAEKHKPDDPWVKLGLAECYRRKGHFEDAETNLVRAIELRPHFQTAKLNLSAVYVAMERYDDAIEYARDLVTDPTYPSPWRAHNNLGWAQLKAGDLVGARGSFETALEYEETFWPARLNLGILEEKLGNRVAAIAQLEYVIGRNPNPFAVAEASYRLGEIYVGMGNRERALEHLTVASQQRPSGPWGKKSEEYLKILR